MISRSLKNLSDTENLARILSKMAEAGDVLLLFGDLGAGKTAFSRAFINQIMGVQTEVPSPTFTLVQMYETPEATLWHFDLYRLKTALEVWELGFEEALEGGISLIEWPERLEGMRFPHSLKLCFYHEERRSEERKVTLHPTGRWIQKLEGFDVG
ncbi:MAG: tRNA (adenosine(37)-N6)-threonylcarbamoyltransferase complex ATPase subunit type 1 TsaE [Alphaproteobacteria bacterium]|nr:tRNA (adenosine(37)-N6)-threonylcarbamoyltransferase complex ATPase subunit type 1 TsaE [Alphaproteobacteria bacterium]